MSLTRHCFARALAYGAVVAGLYLVDPTGSSAQSPGPNLRAPQSAGQPAETLPPTPASLEPQVRQIVADVQVIGNSSSKDFKIQGLLQTRKDREFDPELVQGDVRRLIASGLFRDVRTYTRPTPKGLVVIYEVVERPRIQYIRHLGNRGISEKKLIKEHGLKIGDALNAFSAEEARRKIEEMYLHQGYPKANVLLLEGDKPQDKGVVFVINEGQIQRLSSVSFEGNTIASDGRLKTQIESKPGYFWYFLRGKLDREKIDQDVEKLTAYYRSLGFFRARIGRELQLDDSGKWVTLKFIIDEGPRYEINDVIIEGTTKFEVAALTPFLRLKKGMKFNQDEMNRDVNLLVDLYGSQGHVFADIQPEPRFLEEPGKLDLVYRIQEGDVFHVGNINVHITGDFPHTRESVVLNRLSLRHGDLIDSREVRNSERRLKASQLFITNPQEGDVPRIVVKPPDLTSVDGLADSPPRGSAVRGQSPEEAADEAQRQALDNQRYEQLHGPSIYSWNGSRATAQAAAPQSPATELRPARYFVPKR